MHRALKEFGWEQVPFHRFTANVAWYYVMLTAFVLYEACKRDLDLEALSATWYTTRFWRRVIDIAAKMESTGGRIIVRCAQTAYDTLHLDRLWKRVQHPPPIPPSRKGTGGPDRARGAPQSDLCHKSPVEGKRMRGNRGSARFLSRHNGQVGTEHDKRLTSGHIKSERAFLRKNRSV